MRFGHKILVGMVSVGLLAAGGVTVGTAYADDCEQRTATGRPWDLGTIAVVVTARTVCSTGGYAGTSESMSYVELEQEYAVILRNHLGVLDELSYGDDPVDLDRLEDGEGTFRAAITDAYRHSYADALDQLGVGHN